MTTCMNELDEQGKVVIRSATGGPDIRLSPEELLTYFPGSTLPDRYWWSKGEKVSK